MLQPKCIFVEAGHGDRRWWGVIDKGAVYNGFTERDIVVKIANKLIPILNEKLPYTQVLGVGTNTNASLKRKTQYINNTLVEQGWRWQDCFAICLHLNSVEGKASGIECWIPRSLEGRAVEDKLAKTIIERMNVYFPQIDRGVKQKQLYIDDFKPYTVLIEAGFINDDMFLDYAVNDTDRLVVSLANGILTFLRG